MQSKSFQWQFVTFFRILFASHLLYSGGAYIFFGWVPSAFYNPASPVGQFMVELDKVGLYPLVKYIEFTLGLLALVNRFTPLVAVMEFPITVMIAYLNIFVEGSHEARHYYTGVQELVINGMVLLGYGACYRSMLAMRNEPRWLWEAPGRKPLSRHQCHHAVGHGRGERLQLQRLGHLQTMAGTRRPGARRREIRSRHQVR